MRICKIILLLLFICLCKPKTPEKSKLPYLPECIELKKKIDSGRLLEFFVNKKIYDPWPSGGAYYKFSLDGKVEHFSSDMSCLANEEIEKNDNVKERYNDFEEKCFIKDDNSFYLISGSRTLIMKQNDEQYQIEKVICTLSGSYLSIKIGDTAPMYIKGLNYNVNDADNFEEMEIVLNDPTPKKN